MDLFRAACVIVVVLSAQGASARVKTVSDEDKLQAACYPDVQRLCRDAIPDEGKITVCMEAKKASISKTCTDAYEATRAQ